MKNIYVGNLAFSTTEQAISSLFEPFGRVQRVALIKDSATGRTRGLAFVEMADDKEADRAIAELNGRTIDGRVLTVNEARPSRGGASR